MANILVVDDSRLSRRFSTTPLREAGHQITEAVNGEEGLAAFKEATPDCVVSDLLMPVMDGPTFLAHLRDLSNVPVIVLSADIQETTRDLVEQLGISRFLNKPFREDELLEAVSVALREAEVIG